MLLRRLASDTSTPRDERLQNGLLLGWAGKGKEETTGALAWSSKGAGEAEMWQARLETRKVVQLRRDKSEVGLFVQRWVALRRQRPVDDEGEFGSRKRRIGIN